MPQTVLTNGPDAYRHLLSAAQRSRSVAAEEGYLDLLTDTTISGLGIQIPGLDPVLGDDRLIDMLAAFLTGEKPCDPITWVNLAHMVHRSPSWQASLGLRGVRMPERAEAFDQIRATQATA